MKRSGIKSTQPLTSGPVWRHQIQNNALPIFMHGGHFNQEIKNFQAVCIFRLCAKFHAGTKVQSQNSGLSARATNKICLNTFQKKVKCYILKGFGSCQYTPVLKVFSWSSGFRKTANIRV